MKLEYLPSGSADCPLIRLYDFSPVEAEELQRAISRLASGELPALHVRALPDVETVGGCQLCLLVTPWDQGVVRRQPRGVFDCGLTAMTWRNVAGLIEPLASNVAGHQWLADVPGDAALLMSADGTW